MKKKLGWASAVSAAAMALAAPASAVIIDPAGDFLATYTGPQTGDLDLLSAAARISGDDIFLSLSVNGLVGDTAGGFYAWGVNRGAGTEGALAAPPAVGSGVLHDAVVILRPNLTGQIVLVGPGGVLTFTPLAAGAISVSGDTITGLVPFGLLPTRGFATGDYRYTAWTRSGMGSNALIGDFAPEGSPFGAAVPEPGTWALLILGFGLAGSALRRRNIQALRHG